MLAVIRGNIAPPKNPCKPLKNIIKKKLFEKAQPKEAIKKPDKLIKNKYLVEINLANHPVKGIIMTSAISEADITYDIWSTLAFNEPRKYLKEDPTICTLKTFRINPASIIKNIDKFFLYIRVSIKLFRCNLSF